MKTYIKAILIATIYNVAFVNAECDYNYNSDDICYTIYLTCRKEFTPPYEALQSIVLYNNNRRGLDHSGCFGVMANHRSYYSIEKFHEMDLKYIGTDLSFNQILGNNDIPVLVKDIITTLNISYNSYDEIPPEILKLSNLKRLMINHNSLKTVSLYDLDHHTSLNELDISNNLINTIEHPIIEQYVYKKLKKVNLSYNYLVMIPDLVFKPYVLLTHLDLSHNFIDVLNNLTFVGLKQLHYLNVSNNRLSDINKSLLELLELYELDFSHNQLGAINKVDFEILTNILKLNLAFNEIKLIEKNAFDNLHKLEELDLSYNVLEFLDKELFINSPNLKQVDLTKNNIYQLSTELFENKHLVTFSIKDNCLNGSLLSGMFEGLDLIETIDMSNQYLTGVEDYAFLGLKNVSSIKLNNNKLNKLTFNSFRKLKSLAALNLCNNSITAIDFNKEDLKNLQLLDLHSNQLNYIKKDQLMDLQQLRVLDLSFNKIINIEQDAYKNLSNLVKLIISNNPLSDLQENIFDGLYSLQDLQMSFTQVTILKNNTLNGLSLLRKLNVSHCKISEVQYDAFHDVANVINVDLSYNQLHHFSINASYLIYLSEINLDGNYLKELEPAVFNNLPYLSKLYLINNNLNKFSVDSINQMTHLETLTLSGIDGSISFSQTLNLNQTVTKLVITQSNISNVSNLSLKNLQSIETLVMTFDNIKNLTTTDFSSIKNLNNLDLSFNKITYIQPGTFKDNAMLSILNISHNSLSYIGYGVFHGLTNIDTIDLSYNALSSLQSVNFHDITNLRILIADHNNISKINIVESVIKHFSLSIGDNPVPCDVLVKLFSRRQLVLTTIYKDNSKENVHGITCNIHNHIPTNTTTSNKGENDQILRDIRDILLNISSKIDNAQSDTPVYKNETVLLMNGIRNATMQYSNITKTFLITFKKLFAENSNSTKWLTQDMNMNRNPMESTPKNETSFEEKLKNTLVEPINDLEQQVKLLSEKLKQQPTSKPETIKESNGGHFIFIEICIALILLLLVCFALYKMYYYNVYVLNRRSISIRPITESEANSQL